MKSVALTAFPRTEVRRGRVRRLRANKGRIPAVIYGRRRQPENLELDVKVLEDTIHASATENILVDLSIGAESPSTKLALVQAVQHHPLSGRILHVDFHEVAEDERVTITVPVETTGEAAGVKTGGGVLEHVLFKLKVRALPKDLPEQIVVDVSHLNIGQALHIGDIQPPPGVEILGDKGISVIAVSLPPAEVEEAPAEAAEAAPTEPEVIREKKEEGEEAAAAPTDKKAEKKAEKGAEKPAEKKAAAPAEKKAEKPAEKKAEKKK